MGSPTTGDHLRTARSARARPDCLRAAPGTHGSGAGRLGTGGRSSCSIPGTSQSFHGLKLSAEAGPWGAEITAHGRQHRNTLRRMRASQEEHGQHAAAGAGLCLTYSPACERRWWQMSGGRSKVPSNSLEQITCLGEGDVGGAFPNLSQELVCT